jgi:uncharacterized protein (DUF305 family)
MLVAPLGASPAPTPQSAAAGEAQFLVESEAAMRAMMDGMQIKPGADIDHDFALMMIAHHVGAIDMARAEIHYGTNVRLRRIAQEIVVTQIDEITAMRLAVSEPPQATTAQDKP